MIFLTTKNTKNTKKHEELIIFVFFVFFVVIFLSALPISALAQTSEPRNHILLLDASGSMKERYASGLRDWLIAPLLNSGAFNPNDRVIVRAFDKRGRTDFLKEDPQRRYEGRFNREAILASVPTSESSAGKFTAIPEALETAIADVQAYNLSGDALIWLITDNVQDATGSGDDPIGPFYERIYNDSKFKYIYFFPLVREAETSALVMYVLDYSKTETQLQFGPLMDQVGKAINFRPVLFRPIRLSALELDRGNILFESDDAEARQAELEDGRIVAPISAGGALSGRIKFKLKSKFREWKIEQARVSNAFVSIDYSPSLDLSEGENLQWRLDPQTLDIGPQETSKKTYSIDLASGGRLLEAVRPSFFQSFFVEPEVKVRGVVRFEVEDPQLKLAFFDDAELADRIRRVKGLEEIEQFLMPRNLPASTRNLSMEIPILIKITQPAKPLWLLITLAVMFGILIIGAVVSFNMQTAYRLRGPDGERLIKMRSIASEPISIGQEQAGRLVRRFGTLTVDVHPPFTMESGAGKQRLAGNSDSFIIKNSENNRSWNFSIEGISRKESDESSGNDDLFVS